MNSTLLLTFIIINALALGAVIAIGARYAYAHFHPEKHEPERHARPTQAVRLPADVKEKLLEAAASRFEKILEHSASELQRDMQSTGSTLNQKLERLGDGIVEQELSRYQKSLESIRTETEQKLTSARADIDTHQADLEAALVAKRQELETKMQEEVALEKERLLAQIDTRLADAMASFLLENLGQNVDLGSQASYLTSLLEQHKEEFKQEVGRETPTA